MKTTLKLALAASALAAALPVAAEITACPLDSDQGHIARAWTARWLDALHAAEPGDIARLYAEGAVLMPPSDETIVGRDLISAWLSAHPGPAQQADYQVDIVSCELRGNALHIAGVWGASSAAADGQAALATGNVLRVLEPDAEGGWRSRYEIWN